MQQARALGYSVWDLYLNSWGMAASDNEFPNPTTPGVVLESVAGVVIGPRSLIDRVFVDYTIPSPIVTNGLVPVWSDGRRIIDFYTCRVGSPLKVPVSGPMTIYPWNEYLPGSLYYPDGAAAAALPFASMESPGLHLQFLLKPVSGGVIPTVRDAMYRTRTASGVIAGAETLSRGFPVGGRKRARLHFRVTAGTVTFRVAGIMAPFSSGDLPIEVTLATVAGVTGNNSAYVDTGLAYDWLMVYRTVTAGPANFQYTLIADEECCIGTEATSP